MGIISIIQERLWRHDIKKGSGSPQAYGWIVLVLSFVVRAWSTGLTYSIGVFLIPLCSYFGWQLSEAALAPSLGLLVYAISQPLVGRLVDSIGPKRVIILGLSAVSAGFLLLPYTQSLQQLYLFYGVLGGFGIGATVPVPTAVLVTNWFRTMRGLAVGLTNAGIGIGVPALVPLSSWLIVNFGWRDAFMALGVFTVLILLLTLLIRDAPVGGEVSKTTVAEEFSTPMSMVIRSGLFWKLLIPYTVCGFTVYFAGIHLIPLAVMNGVSQSDASIAVAWMGTVMALGLIIAGPLVDVFGGRVVLIMSYLVRSMIMPLLLVRLDLMNLYIFATVFGFVELATIPPTVIFCRKFFGAGSMGFAYGLVFMGHQLGGAASVLVGGLAATLTGSYNLIIILSSLLTILAAGISATIK